MATFKQNIILVYDKTSDRLNDKSDDITSFCVEQDHVFIVYKNSGRKYRYNSRNAFKLHLKEAIDPINYDIYIDNELQSGITAIGHYGSHYAILSKSCHIPQYIAGQRLRLESGTASSILNYMSKVAECIDKEEHKNDKKDKEYSLAAQFENIFRTKDNILDAYLNKIPIRTRTAPEILIYPFDVNTSQKEAIKNALSHNISIIQGPPGTGKTQSILNLIANLVYQGKSVGIVSNNNSAIENVKYRLDKAGYGFLSAHLGKRVNRDCFFDTLLSDYKPDIAWRQKEKTIKATIQKLSQIDRKIDVLFVAKSELASLQEALSRIKHEKEIFYKTFGIHHLPEEYAKLQHWNSDKLVAFKTVISNFAEKVPFSKLPFYLSCCFRFGHVFALSMKAEGHELCLALDSLIYDKKIEEIQRRIPEIESVLKGKDLNTLLHTCSELSTVIFKHALYRRYSSMGKTEFTSKNYQTTKFAKFIERFPVILSTTHSILSSVSSPLDYLIVDESSQVDVITASLAFSVCRNIVIVGDERQLSHIVTDSIKEEANKLSADHRIAAEYDYVKNNIIVSLRSLYRDTVPTTLLREHYRCDPLIIGFCNQKYYHGKLIIMKERPENGYGKSDYPVRIFRTVEGNYAYGTQNTRQIEVIREEVLPQCKDVSSDEIGIVTPFRKQAALIIESVCKDSGMEADTIHKFQGREKKKIIFSTVSNQINDFIDQAEIINVAVSRAVDQFIMVMPHSYELVPGSNIGDLIRYIEHWNPFGSIYSNTVSCFDLLRPVHSKSLDEFEKRIKGHSRFLSENICEALLDKILTEEPKYSGFYVRHEYPLYLLTPNKTGLTQREIDFSNNRLAHVDFLIINRCDNSFVLAIEVDGYMYHSSLKQKERDAIKDKVLTLNGIELLRMSTRGIMEEDAIREKLRELTSSSRES